MPRIAVARREAPLGLTIRTPRRSSNARRFTTPCHYPAWRPRGSDCDRGVLFMICYNKVWALRTPSAGSVRAQIQVV